MIKIVICGYGVDDSRIERCRASIKMQDYTDYDVTEIINEDPRKYLLENTVVAINRSNPDNGDVIVCVDSDDFLCDERALRIIADTYRRDERVQITHGTYVNYSTGERGKFNGSYLPGESFRSAKWRGTHLKTFKYDLFKRVPERCFIRNGQWLECCADRAMMIPMMEKAGIDSIKYIDTVLYCYDDTNPKCVWKTMREKSKDIRSWIERQPPV